MIPENDVHSLLTGLKGSRVLVVGDLVLDHYLEGSVTRISPEAPVPVVSLGENGERWLPGAAANVALNVLSLGGIPYLAGVVGDDSPGRKLRSLLQKAGVDVRAVVTDSERPTTVKTRIMGRNQQLIRVDRESTQILEGSLAEEFTLLVTGTAEQVGSIIIEDYNKGVLSPGTIAPVLEWARTAGIPVAVDPKLDNFWEYGGCCVFKPNMHEAGAALGIGISNPEQAGEAARRIASGLPADNVLLTLGAMGSVLFNSAEAVPRHIPTVAQHVFDVSGAGDSVIAVMGLGLACGMDVADAAKLANLAAAAVCAEPGVYAVKPSDIITEASRFA